MKKLLPQANSLNTVIKVFVYASTKRDCTIGDIAEFCSFDPRQASYYINACYYLGLVDENGVCTALGKDIMENIDEIWQRVFFLIVRDGIIGEIFHYKLIFPNKDAREFAVSYLKQQFPDYSDAVINRRASTLLNWCDEILTSPLIAH
jgi:hypothetical protein